MKKLDIFTVENFIFLNPKAKKILWKEFHVFFKEYIFLKQAGIDNALLGKLYMKFFEKFYQKKYKSYIKKIFGDEEIQFDYNFNSMKLTTVKFLSFEFFW